MTINHTFAVRNKETGTTVGMYNFSKAEELRDEWNANTSRVRGNKPYIVIEFQEVISEAES